MITFPPNAMASLCLPVLSLSAFLALVSGKIPSPLYRRGDTWPRWYVIIQVAMLCLTSLRLRSSMPQNEEELNYEEDSGYEEDLDYEEDSGQRADMELYLRSIDLMGNTLYGWSAVMERNARLIAVVSLIIICQYMTRKSSMDVPLHGKRETQKKTLCHQQHPIVVELVSFLSC